MSKEFPPIDVERATRKLYSPYLADIPIRIKNWTAVYKPETKMRKFLHKLFKRKAEKITPYDEIRPYLQTFDIINCVPRGFFMGLVGHTAMVYRCKATGQVMVYESTQTGRGDGKPGVQLRPMREWAQNYKGKIYIRHSYIRGDPTSPPHRLIAESKCSQHIRKHRGTAYPNLRTLSGLWFVANAAIDLWFKNRFQNKDRSDVMFCTQLVGHCLRYCKLIDETVNPAEWEPDDVRGYKYLNRYCAAGVAFGPEIRIK